MVELSSKSNPENRKETKDPNFIDLASSLVMYLTGHADPRAIIILRNPLLDAVGSIEASYLALRAEAHAIDRFGGN